MNANRTVIVATTVVLALGVGGWIATRKNATAEITYRTAVVERTDLKKTVSATGSVQALTTVDIKSKAGGEVKLLAVDVGAIVKPGDLIARIDPTDSRTAYDQAESDVSAAQAHVTQTVETLDLQKKTAATADSDARAQVEAAQARYAQAVAQSKAQPEITDAADKQAEAGLIAAQEQLNQLRAGGDPQTRADAKMALDTAEANLANAEQNLKREESLSARGFVAQSAVDQAKTQRDVAMAQAESARVRANTTNKQQLGAIAYAESQVALAKAALRSSKAQDVQIALRQQDVASAHAALLQAKTALQTAIANEEQIGIKAADILSAKAAIDRSQEQFANAKVQLDSTTIRSPRAGVVLQKYVEQGTIITSGQSLNSPGTSIVQIGDVSRIFVNASVDEADVAQVTVGQKVKVALDAFPDQEWDGIVRRVNPLGTTDQNVTTVLTLVEILHPIATIRPGLNAECEFVVAEKPDVIAIPTRALHNRAGEQYVLVLTPGPKSEAGAKSATLDGETGTTTERPVTIGMEAGDLTEIVSGLSPGDKVVTATNDPNSQQNSGAPGANKQGGGPGGMGSAGKPGGMGGFGK